MSNSLDNLSNSESDNSSESESSVTSSVLQPINTISGNSNSCNINNAPSECPSNSYLIWSQMPSFSVECSYDNAEQEESECQNNTNTNHVEDSVWNVSNIPQLEPSENPYNLINVVGGNIPWEVAENVLNDNNSNSLNTITSNYVNTNNQYNSDTSNDEEQTTDYNNEESISAESSNTTSLQNIGVPNLNLENISNINTSSNLITISEVNQNSNGTSNQYSMLYNDDVNNPFYKCNLGELEYDTDEEENNDTYRVIYFWNYEFNYDYFSLNEVYIFNEKTELFKSKLSELKSIRNSNISNSTGNIIKLESSSNISNIVNLYLIAYYDNAKTNIEFYGIYNQEIDEEKLIENIKLESTYGKKGSVSSNLITNLGENDFIVLHRKVNVN